MSKTTARASKYVVIGIILTIFNFIIYTFLARVIIQNNNYLWLATAIAYALATVLAYFLHSKITWQERPVTKHGVLMFFVWNIVTALFISPFFTWLFGFITPVYEFAFNISSALHLPFDYNFIESTGVFCFATLITMIFNYLFYDKLVFGDCVTPPTKNSLPSPDSKVSIIVPIYNTAKYLPKCLDSIINQTYQNLEIILVDDGSTDDSKKIADHYTKKDKRIKVVHQKNQGQSTARNTGLSKATGDYISFIDADDEIEITFIKELLELYNKNISITVCGHQYRRLKTQTSKNLYQSPLKPRRPKESQKSYILKLLTKDGRMYSCNNKLFRASAIIKHHLIFDKNLNFAEDTKFVLDYLKNAKGEIAYTPLPLYIYNSGTETSTMRTVSTNWQNWQTSYQNLKTWLGPNPSLREKFWLHLVHLRWRISYIRSKKRAKL